MENIPHTNLVTMTDTEIATMEALTDIMVAATTETDMATNLCTKRNGKSDDGIFFSGYTVKFNDVNCPHTLIL